MKPVKSKYKLFGGFSLILFLCLMVSILACIICAKFLEDSSTSMVLSITLLTIGYVLALLLLLGQIKFLKIHKDSLVSTTPVFIFLRKTIRWTEYDYYVTVDEHSNGNSHEAVWIINNQKVTHRFSSFYYSNYNELKNNLQIEYKGKIDVGALSQLFYILGGKFEK